MLRDAVRLALRRLLEISRPRAPAEREVRRARATLADVPILFTPQRPQPPASDEPTVGHADAPPAPEPASAGAAHAAAPPAAAAMPDVVTGDVADRRAPHVDAPPPLAPPVVRAAVPVDAPAPAPVGPAPTVPARPPVAPPPVAAPIVTVPVAAPVAAPVAVPVVVPPSRVDEPAPAVAPTHPPARPPAPPPPPAAPPPSLEELAARVYVPPGDDLAVGTEGQLALLRELAPVARTFDWPEQRTPGRRFWARNGALELGDAVVLYAMLRRLRPREVVVVGAGVASALLLDVNERDFERRTRLTFVEPRPERVKALLRDGDQPYVRVIPSTVGELAFETLDVLAAGDLLLVDAPHDAERAADVSHAVFRVLPSLRAGVVVHLPNVVWPFEPPAAWPRDGRAAHALDVVHAFLQYNTAFEILLFDSQIVAACGDVATRLVPPLATHPGGSLWLRRTAHR